MTARRDRSPEKIDGRVKFLLFVLGLYGIAALFDPALAMDAFGYFAVMLVKVAPVLALVFVVLLLTNIFLNPERIHRHLGRESGLKGWLYAVAAGLVISGPPYLLFPMLGELKRHGARNALLAAILYNRNVKIHFLPAIVYYFGLRYTVVLSFYIILFSLINGKLVELLIGDDSSPETGGQKG
ncbi:MAG: hypothetical protein LC633_00875 [Desulfobulbaceae bacterium]|nr:hypothetical protein [Desulfobulbaceae bacterium]